MGDDEDSSCDTSGFATAQAEREATYPDEGFVLVEIDMLKPPGEALTRLDHSLYLTELTVPPGTDMTDYVVYDPDGNSYGQWSLQETRDRVDAREIDGLVDDVESGTIRERRLALFGLAELAEDSPEACLDAVPILAERLHGTEPDIRAVTLDILATVADAYPEYLTPAAEDVLAVLDPGTEPGVLGDAIGVVAAIADHEPKAVVDAAPTLAAVLQEGTAAESPAMRALYRIGTEYPDAVVPAASKLVQYVEHSEESERVGAIAVLGAISKEYPNVAESTIPVASGLLDAEDDRLRANAAGLLADLAGEYSDQVVSVVPRAIELLDDPDEKARYNATSILSRVAKRRPADVEPAIDPLVSVLNDDFPHSRANACWALGYVGADRALEQLEALERSDPSEEVQHAAAFAVDEITGNSSG